jgi:hypothetical protein
MIDTNEQLTMEELLFNMKQKYDDLDITSQHLGRGLLRKPTIKNPQGRG